jgi:signal recognition particle subunit SRP54
MAGLQGAGKTTTVGKLGKLLQRTQKKKVLVVSCDVYRPAAIEQLKTVAGRPGSISSRHTDRRRSRSTSRWRRRLGKQALHDVLLVDTAGRLAIDEAMMAEIARPCMRRSSRSKRCSWSTPCSARMRSIPPRAFNEALPLTGVVLTKLDGDARGGAALSVRHVTGKPIKFAGVGEKLSGLEPFHPERMASRILGMGDVLSLIEEARKGIDEEKAKSPSPRSSSPARASISTTSRSRSPDAQDGRPVVADGQAAGAVRPGGRPFAAGRRRDKAVGASRASSTR